VGQELRPAVVGPDDVDERLDPLVERVARDLGVAEEGEQLIRPVAHDRDQELLARPEVVLDDAPRDAGAGGDAVRGGPVVALLDDRGHRGGEHAVAGRRIAGPGHAHRC
jgi:hypothetical protein